MNKTELATILQAGYVIINPVAQSESYLDLFNSLLKSHFGNILTSDVIEYDMDNREMIRNLVQFGGDAKALGIDFVAELNRKISNSESKSVCDEIIRVILDKKLDPLKCPMLDAFVQIENIADEYK